MNLAISRTATAVALVLAVSVFAQPAGSAPAPGRAAEGPLFTDTAEDKQALRPLEPWELRQRLAGVDWQVLRPLCEPAGAGRPDTVTLNLFPEVTLTAEADHVGRTDRADSLRWRGEVLNAPDSSVTLAAIGLCGRHPGRTSLAGSVHFNGEEYTIRPRSGGRVIITEIDSTAAGLLQKPAAPPPGHHRKVRTARAPKPRAARADNVVIDALVLYTPGAVKQAGGTEEIESWIGDAANRANDNLAESGVDAEFRVVDVRQATGYRSKETVQPAFNALTNPRDGQLDEATALREAYGADVVTTVVAGYDPKTMVAGLASYPENPRNPATGDQVWSVVAANQLWASILAHEWGHLLGLDHDWQTSPEQNSYFPDNHGYVAADKSFVTIMGYPSACAPRPCPYTDYYANPRLSVDGKPLGVPLGGAGRPADNTRVMNITAPQVAAYRSSRTGTSDMDLGLAAGPPAGGTVNAEVKGPYAHGDTVSVIADPAPGSVFAGWTLDGRPAGMANPLTLTMNSDHQLVARFAKGKEARFPFGTVAVPDHAGTIALKPGGTTFQTGTKVLARATARDGYEFQGWELDGTPAGDDETLVVETSRAHTLVARFAKALRLTARPAPATGGQVKLSDDSSNAYGVDVIAQATAARGYLFSHWTLDGRPHDNRPVTSVTVSGDQTLVAVFKKIAAAKKRLAVVKKKQKKRKKVKRR